MLISSRLKQYALLMRLDKPIGILLLLWPTLWALWLASDGLPPIKTLSIFILGVIFMRSAGCIANDIADQKFDAHVLRTRHRPLATKKISVIEAILLLLLMLLFSLGLVLMLNRFTIQLAIVGASITLIYPYLKRITHFPQLGLGVAFAWSVLMVFANQKNEITFSAFFLFVTAIIWPIIYDTLYAMVDRDDDLKIGIKSTAIFFNVMDKLVIALLQCLFIVMMIIVGITFRLHKPFYLSLFLVVILFIYQQWLIRNRTRDACFTAFLNNNLVGFFIFLGILASYFA